MSSSVGTTELNDCGCCEGISSETPQRVANRPGLSAIAYRVGDHARFKETLLARLTISNQPALRSLTTRDDDDFSIALLDAWATVSDVLTFYQERIANEAYLRTATERLSILELARLIDYRLRPGVAASTYLAFTLEDAPGALGQSLAVGTTAQTSTQTLPTITIPIGLKVQSIPGPGEQAQTFETVEEVEAKPEWNAIKPRTLRPQKISASMETIILEGTATNLKQGDRLLINDGVHQPSIRIVLKVTVDDEAQTTRVDFSSTPPDLPAYKRPTGLATGDINTFPEKVELTSETTGQIISLRWSAEDLAAVAQIQGWDTAALTANVAELLAQSTLASGAGVFAFRQQSGIFGHNAPSYKSLIKADGNPIYKPDWDKDGFEIWKEYSETDKYYTDADIYLERSLTGITEDTWIILERSTSKGPARTPFIITEVSEASIVGFGLSGKSTGLRLAEPNGHRLEDNTTDKPPHFKVRKTTVFLQSEELTLAELPIVDVIEPSAVTDDGITLDAMYIELKVGQRVILTGERADLECVINSEPLTLKEVVIEAGFTVVKFKETLAYSYVRDTVTINANVALATHGETVNETLGGGDATKEFQRFTLLQSPLTYVSAANPAGSESTLEVRVNDLLWHEVSNFFGHDAEERIYVTRTDDDGKTTVIFGDGKTGARPPTGQENVKATYRKGIGLSGQVKADQLTLLLTRPLGVKGVTNPNDAAGAADPEQLEDARRNAPITILTLDRIVSRHDYEDFARGFSGIAKALATWTFFGEKRGIVVTVAGSEGAEVEEGSELYNNLLDAIQDAGDSTVLVRVKSYQQRLFRLTATLTVDPDFLSEEVLADVEQKLFDAFSFDAREFGQPVHLSEVITVMQNVRGVVAVDVDEFYRADQMIEPLPPAHLAAAFPRPGDKEVIPAELLTLDPGGLKLEVAE